MKVDRRRFERWPMYAILGVFLVGATGLLLWKVPRFALLAGAVMAIPIVLFIIGDAFHDTVVGRAIGRVFGAVEDLFGEGTGGGDAGVDGGGAGDC